MSKWLDRAKLKISESGEQGTAKTDVRTLSAVTAVPHPPESENFESSNGSNGSAQSGHFQNFTFSDTPPDSGGPATWDRIGEFVRAGWHLEFGPIGPDGRQPITRAIPPGQGRPAEQRRDESAPNAHPEDERAPTTLNEAQGTTSGPVCCADCRHFRRDAIGDGQGIGDCGAGVPARPGFPARYPKAERYCRDFAAVTRGEANGADHRGGPAHA
jgi:hypothetical protein